jgi:hypothetical protein
MFIPFDEIHDRSRIWIYQTNRKLNDNEVRIISEALKAFTDSWMVHGSPMQASFDIRFNRFIIIAADEGINAASGCSIDTSTRMFKKLGSELNVDFFDRTQVVFHASGEVFSIPTSDLKDKLSTGAWNAETIVFNNLVTTKKDLDKSWQVSAGTTWLKRFLPKQTVDG